MKKIITVLLISLALFAKAQMQPFDVYESTMKVGGLGEETYVCGFCEGDQCVFNFEEVNGKELKELEIIELPSSSKFMDYKTTKIQNKTINITKTGIYKFRFANSAIGGRICKVKIQRIPASDATKNFNTSVYYKTIYDTTYTTEQEKYLISKGYKVVTLQSPEEHVINGGFNATVSTGKSRIIIPVVLPKNTVEWYYTYSSYRDKAQIDKVKGVLNLTGQLTKLIDETGTLNFGIDMLTKPPGGDVCDIYLLDFANSGLFEAKEGFRSYAEGKRENIKSGVIKVKEVLTTNQYIGIKNPDSFYPINVVIEIAAITYEEQWGTRPVQKMHVNSHQEEYLKN